jgi:ubiquinone/menaquinone biosynthesis C-methylase UbiE
MPFYTDAARRSRLVESKGDITRFNTVDREIDPGFFIQFLDAGNALEDIRSVKRVMTTLLDLGDGLTLLDVGCGTGDDVRDLASMLGRHGRAVGVDVSGAMIAEAKNRHAASGLPLEFCEGEAHDLKFPDASFDRCRTERMFMHLDRPEQALAEMVRVMRPGGRIVVFDFDWDTVFVDSPFKATTRKIVQAFSDGIRNGWIGRSLPRLFQEAGLTEITCAPHAVRIYYAFARRLFEGHLSKAEQMGVLPAGELAAWWNHLEKASAAGQFQLGFLGFIVAGRKP